MVFIPCPISFHLKAIFLLRTSYHAILHISFFPLFRNSVFTTLLMALIYLKPNLFYFHGKYVMYVQPLDFPTGQTAPNKLMAIVFQDKIFEKQVGEGHSFLVNEIPFLFTFHFAIKESHAV